MATTRNLAIVLFEDAEVLDFCGPYEVFSLANRESDLPAFNVFLVAEVKSPVVARNGLSVNPDFDFEDAPHVDVLLVPGGIGTRKQLENDRLLDWIRRTADVAEMVLSVCTGALVLGKAGLLNGLELTTHHVAYDLLRELVPDSTVHEDRRFVDNGKVITSAGIAAGIDMSLYVVQRLVGYSAAVKTAKHMEYPWDSDTQD